MKVNPHKNKSILAS